jgi:hypothetical protein
LNISKGTEKAFRAKILEENEKLNSTFNKASKGAKFGINKFSLLTIQERKNYLGEADKGHRSKNIH